MAQDTNSKDPLEFIRGMWSNMGFSLPGMVTPTLDVDELDKRIKDMKAVEGWLKMNLNMLQMSIQGLEMQRAALAAVKAISEPMRKAAAEDEPREAPEKASTAAPNPSDAVQALAAAAASMWPWNMLNQQQAGAAPTDPAPEAEAEPEAPPRPKAQPPKGGRTKKV
ncbi:MAG: hypothetical protein JNJ44_04515 [Zoogloeaceae bacterium]|nr:hypothetical protein [Zoogloeaceae bacterium]